MGKTLELLGRTVTEKNRWMELEKSQSLVTVARHFREKTHSNIKLKNETWLSLY